MYLQKVLLFNCLACVSLASAFADTSAESQVESLRQSFLDGQRAASRGEILKSRQHYQQLLEADYVLAPYLQLSIMLNDLYAVPEHEVTDFLKAFENTWLGEKLRLNWLVVLKSQRDYQSYVDNFIPGTGNGVQQCFYNESLYRLGRREEAFAGARELWLVGKSQSSACDWLFSRWRSSDHFSDELIWDRFILARRAGQYALARYLESSVKDKPILLRMQAYHRVRSEPEILENTSAFIDEGGASYSEVVAQGLRNLADKNLAKSLDLWPIYRDSGVLSLADRAYVLEELLDKVENKGGHEEALEMASRNPELLEQNTIRAHLAIALSEGNWSRAQKWLDLVPEVSANDEQWQYWRARIMVETGEDAAPIFAFLAEQRSYYGFLASMLLERPFSLNDRSSAPDPQWRPNRKLARALERALELEYVGYRINASLTWQHAVHQLSEADQVQAAWLASQAGNHYLAIRASIESGAWDELQIRFPLAYPDEFNRAAEDSGIPLVWLYAISRQESSFAPEINSPAGATGLMQLMPGTAGQMARSLDVSYNPNRLSEPDYNLRLGTAYLAMAYQELHQNPVYATAAYNAGISRVKSWLRNQPELPMDIWIESIPFYETRNYVKNVLAYSVIYGDRLSAPALLEMINQRMFIAYPTAS